MSTINPNPTQFPNVQAVSLGMAVARLPNGTYTTVPFSGVTAVTTTVLSSLNNTSITQPSSFQSLTASSTMATNLSNRNLSLNKSRNQPTSTADVLRRLNDQITALQRVRNPTESQLHRLKQLVEVRIQLARASIAENIGPTNCISAPILPVASIVSCAGSVLFSSTGPIDTSDGRKLANSVVQISSNLVSYFVFLFWVVNYYIFLLLFILFH